MISVGTATFVWDGRTSDGGLLDTGNYWVRAQVLDLGLSRTYGASLTLIIEQKGLLGGVRLGPNPASELMTISLETVPAGTELDIEIWNLAGELVFSTKALAGPGAKVEWSLHSSSGQAISDGIYVLQLRSVNEDPRLRDKRFLKVVVRR